MKKWCQPYIANRIRQWHPTPVLLPGKSHGRRSLVGCSPLGRTESDMTEPLHFHVSLSCIEEGNGNPLQCSCLENPRDGEPGGLPSMGSHRVGHDWSNSAAAAAYIIYFRKQKRKNIYWLVSWGQYNPDTTTWERHHKKRNCRPICLVNTGTNITDKILTKTAIYEDNDMPWPNVNYSRNTRLV